MIFPEEDYARNIDEIVDLITMLQSDSTTDPTDLMGIEWAFLPALDRHSGSSPKLLEQALAEDPLFFCEVVRKVFMSEKEDTPPPQPVTEQDKNIARNAYRLLTEWKTPPGTQKDGTFHDALLNTWLSRVKKVCAESGHLDIALLWLVMFWFTPQKIRMACGSISP
jgi:hypothetical protein